MRIRNRAIASAILRCPLMGTSRALGQFPFVAEQIGEEVVAPLRGCLRPNDFQSAANGVTAIAFAQLVFPPEALQFDVGTLRLSAHILCGNASTVGFAEGVTASNEGDGLFIVHRHAAEGLGWK